MENISTSPTCIMCHVVVPGNATVCPHCGVTLHNVPSLLSIKKLAFIFFISFFLAPFGLGYAYTYLKNPDPKMKKVGKVVVILTIIAVILMIFITKIFTDWQYNLIQ